MENINVTEIKVNKRQKEVKVTEITTFEQLRNLKVGDKIAVAIGVEMTIAKLVMFAGDTIYFDTGISLISIVECGKIRPNSLYKIEE